MNYDKEIDTLKHRISEIEFFSLDMARDIERIKNEQRKSNPSKLAWATFISATIIGVIQILIACFK